MGGQVWLVGAGPGAPGLLTLRGREVLEQAETVVYDRLVSEELLLTIPPSAHLINAGKAPRNHPLPQEEINRILIEEARKGRKVVRLKGGDPFLFGRGWEELLALTEARIPVEAVPGVSSALAVPALAGIPVTHRGRSSALHIISWHSAAGSSRQSETVHRGTPQPEVLRGLAAAGGTLVILMGGSALEEIAQQLIPAGFPPDTPAALITEGTTPRQLVIRTVLKDMGKAVNPGGPVLIVIGSVCSLAETAPDTETSQLAGSGVSPSLSSLRIVVTRPKPQNAETCDEIRVLGGQPIPFPCIEFQPLAPDEWDSPDSAWREAMANCQWLAFTSAHGVECFFKGFRSSGGDFRSFAGRQFAVIGPATAKALTEQGFVPDCMPSVFNGAQLGETLAERLSPGEEVLLIQGRVSAESFSRTLEENAVPFRRLAVYKTIPAEGGPITRRLISEGRFDLVLFASPSAVSVFAGTFSLATAPAIVPAKLPVKALCIGETTAARAREFGMEVVVARESSMAELYRLAVNRLG